MRLKQVFSYIPRCGILADVGCDHGYLGAEVLSAGKADTVWFCDISQKCLDKARRLCELRGLSGAEFFVGDGLGDLKVDCAVIAGMGGHEIISIVQNADKPQTLVLQPMTKPYEVRRVLNESYGFDEDIIVAEEGRFYNVMKLSLSHDRRRLSEKELLFGVTNLRDKPPAFMEYIEREIEKCEAVLKVKYVSDIAARLAVIKEIIC